MPARLCRAGALALGLLLAACAGRQPQPAAPAAPPPSTPAPTGAATAPPPPPVATGHARLRPDAPTRYVVKKGDTLWDIAARFLRNPWYWPEIWHENPQIRNPHRIYPGDVISLYYVDGRPRLGITRPGAYHLRPSVRTYPLQDKDVGIPIATVRPFLVRPRVVPPEVLQRAPHVLDSQDARLIYGSGDRVYVRGLANAAPGARYSLYRPGAPLRDPDTGELLGYEAVHTADARVLRGGEPATVVLEDAVREVLRGDRLMPLDEGQRGFYFIPHPPPHDPQGRIIALHDALTGAGQYQVVVLNRGERDGLEPGTVLAVRQAGRVVQDPLHGPGQSSEVTLPTERAGLVMVFRAFDRVSYALVMSATRPMGVGDLVTVP